MFILLYHQISSIPLDKDPLHLAVTPDLFEKEMCHLKEAGYECKPVRYIAEMMSRSEPVPENYIAITFYFDKSNKLNYKQTILKPDCYNKKQFIPFLSFNNTDDSFKKLMFISLFSILVLLSVFISTKMKQRTVYV